MRAVCDAVGIKNILAKSLGSSNHANVLKATLDALGKLQAARRRDETPRNHTEGIPARQLIARIRAVSETHDQQTLDNVTRDSQTREYTQR